MCCTEIENLTDSAEITNMIETCPRYSRNLIREGEVRVKYETKVPSKGCGRKGNATIEMKCWILNLCYAMLYIRWPTNHTMKFVRRYRSKTLAKTVKFGIALADTFLNISSQKYTNTWSTWSKWLNWHFVGNTKCFNDKVAK